MNQPPCNLENSILEGDLEFAAKQQTINEVMIMETPEGFYVIVTFTWATGKEWYLTTRRNRTAPKLYKDLIRLNNFMKGICPNKGFELIRNQSLPIKY